MYRFLRRNIPRPALVPFVLAVVIGIAFPVATVELMVSSATAARRSRAVQALPTPCLSPAGTELARR